MKKSFIILWVALAIASLVSCASYRDAYVTYANDGGKIVMDDAGGSSSPERYIKIQNKQNESSTLSELERQQRNAIKNQDMMLADSLQDIIDRKKFSDNINNSCRPSGYGGYGGGGYSSNYSGSNNYRQVSANNGKLVKLGMINNSPDDVRILNGPFAGLTLNAGKATAKSMPWPSGVFLLEYEIFPAGASYSFKTQINVSIPEDRTTPISFYRK